MQMNDAGLTSLCDTLRCVEVGTWCNGGNEEVLLWTPLDHASDFNLRASPAIVTGIKIRSCKALG